MGVSVATGSRHRQPHNDPACTRGQSGATAAPPAARARIGLAPFWRLAWSWRKRSVAEGQRLEAAPSREPCRDRVSINGRAASRLGLPRRAGSRSRSLIILHPCAACHATGLGLRAHMQPAALPRPAGGAVAAGRTHTSSEVSQLVVLAISAGKTLSHWPCQGHELHKSEPPPALYKGKSWTRLAALVRTSWHSFAAARTGYGPRARPAPLVVNRCPPAPPARL